MSDPLTDTQLPAQIIPTERLLTAAEFQRLADVPPEIEWFANITNRSTRRAYENAIHDFMRFTGIVRPEEFRTVTRAHVIAWHDDLGRREDIQSGATVRHRLAALSSLFEYLCEKNAVSHNPVKGVKRPKAESGEGKTPAIGDHQARELLSAPGAETIKEKRDRAILSTLLYHALRREELCKLKGQGLQARPARRAASERLRQGREDPVSAAASRDQRTDPRLPRGGGSEWLHLRLCRTCGHVGCCDDSPNHHATKHFHATRHPIIEGYDPPEGWGWCYVDEVMLNLSDRATPHNGRIPRYY